MRNCAYASATLSAAAAADCGTRAPRVAFCPAAASDTETLHSATTRADFICLNCSTKPRRCHIVPVMPVDPELLEILACPNCKTPVTLIKNGAALKCATCKRVYPIKDDIPVMLIDEATIED